MMSNQKGKTIYQRYLDSRNSVRRMPPEDCAWLAAAIDGEGSIGLYDYPTYGRVFQLTLNNTNQEFVQHCKGIIGNLGSTVKHYTYGGHGNGEVRGKPIFNWSLKGANRVCAVLEQIVPYLIIKKDKAQSMIDELRQHPTGRWSMQTDEGRKRQSDLSKQSWQNPAIRASRIRGLQKVWEEKRVKKNA